MRGVSKIQAGVVFIAMVAGMVPTALADTVGAFSDVAQSHVNNSAIEYLKEKGVLQGYADGTYKPAADINRAEFTKIIVASLTKDPKGANCFKDVSAEWYAPYICEAKTRGIVSGYADGTFKPSAVINFSEASKIIVNAYGVQSVGTAPSKDRWFKPFVSGLEAKNDIPLSIEFFDENVKRDAMAEMVYRLKADVTDKPTRTYEEVVGDDFVTVDSCVELKERFDEQNAYDYVYFEGGGGVMPMMAEPGRAMAAPSGAMEDKAATAPQASMGEKGGGGGGDEGAATDFSSTNLQVAGVDEADVIKNDGKFIYIIKADELRIVEAYPAANLKELTNMKFGEKGETFTPTEMYVDGNRLTIIGSDYKDVQPVQLSSKISADYYYPYYNNRTKVFVLDITDRSKPKVVRAVEFDGSYNTSRKIDGTLYMVMNYNYSPIYYGGPMPMVSESSASAAVIPKMLDTKKGSEEAIAPCNKIRILPKQHNFNYLITAAVPLNDNAKDVSRSVVVGATENIYASTDNLYVAGTDWGGGFYRPYGDYGTSIYRFALGNGTIEYKAKGRVPGQLLNQFSMDESGDHFRVATTKSSYGPNGENVNNNVYVLNMDMAQTGKIENIAPGEKLYSARFMGDKAYLVTFKRIDPFFVLDLSNPSSPKIAGKLKVPGYSDYLQPYDDTHILGFGYDVDETKVTADGEFLTYDAKKGFKISMFDVSDMANPREIFKTVIGDHGTYSPVSTEHKALLFDKAKGLLALPVTVYDPNSKPVFDGAYVFNVNLSEGFKLKGKVSHYSLADGALLGVNGYTDYEKTIQRALYIGENLYTVSPYAVKANALSDLAEKGMVKLGGTIYYPPMPL